MLDREQYLLTKLAEEAAEVQQRALKMMQFGRDEIQEGQNKTNRQRLTEEIRDMGAVLELLKDEGFIETWTVEVAIQHAKDKWAKMAHYLELSRKLGRVE